MLLLLYFVVVGNAASLLWFLLLFLRMFLKLFSFALSLPSLFFVSVVVFVVVVVVIVVFVVGANPASNPPQQEAILVIFNWLLEVWLLLVDSKNEYMDAISPHVNLNNAVKHIAGGLHRNIKRHFRRRRRKFARREERKKGVKYYDVATISSLDSDFDFRAANFNASPKLRLKTDVVKVYLSALVHKIQVRLASRT